MKSTATENQPIACTLIEGDFRDRLAWIAELTRDALRSYERADLTLELRYDPESVQRVQEMIRKERACCAFLMFEIREEADEVWRHRQLGGTWGHLRRWVGVSSRVE
jgi:hypothetical protein